MIQARKIRLVLSVPAVCLFSSQYLLREKNAPYSIFIKAKVLNGQTLLFCFFQIRHANSRSACWFVLAQCYVTAEYIAKHVEDVNDMPWRIFLFHIAYTITRMVNEKINSSFKKEDDDDGKKIVYNTVGPNVCMGDHKVKTGPCYIFNLLFRWTRHLQFSYFLSLQPVFLFFSFKTNENWLQSFWVVRELGLSTGSGCGRAIGVILQRSHASHNPGQPAEGGIRTKMKRLWGTSAPLCPA